MFCKRFGLRLQASKNHGGEPRDSLRNRKRPDPLLPEICAAHLPSDNSAILIKRGERGYCLRWEAYDGERFNKHHGITDAQVGAMLTGSMFGFDCPGADPLNH